MEKIKVGILGLGRAGFRMHFREMGKFPEMFEIVAGCDNDPERRKNTAPGGKRQKRLFPGQDSAVETRSGGNFRAGGRPAGIGTVLHEQLSIHCPRTESASVQCNAGSFSAAHNRRKTIYAGRDLRISDFRTCRPEENCRSRVQLLSGL